MKDEEEVRKQWRDRKSHYEQSESGNKDFQQGYVFALAWVLEFHEDSEGDQ